MGNKILFISHDASLTGAPILLLNLVKWLKQNSSFHFDIYLLAGGELEQEFNAVCNVLIYEPPQLKPIGLKRQLINRVFGRKTIDVIAEYTKDFYNNIKNGNYSVIYGNTVVSISVFEKIHSLLPNAKLIVHVHELFSITSLYANYFEMLKDLNIKYLSVSELTKKNLLEKHGLNSELIYEYIDVNYISKFHKEKNSEHFVINGSGLVQPRKGYDIFILIAKRAKQKYGGIPFYFKWIGHIPPYLKPYIDSDIINAELEQYVEFADTQNIPYSLYSESDVFLVTSREDPFPIVSLEHACLGKPIICFDKASGIPEFVGDNAGVIIPYLDIEKLVDTLAYLYYNKNILLEMGAAAKFKVEEFDINKQALKILKIIANA